MEKFLAPWDAGVVESLTGYQKSGRFHEFTCGNGHALVPEPAGWRCPACEADGLTYSQNWCWVYGELGLVGDDGRAMKQALAK